MPIKITCPHCATKNGLTEPLPLPGSQTQCVGCGARLAISYPQGVVEALKAKGKAFQDAAPDPARRSLVGGARRTPTPAGRREAAPGGAGGPGWLGFFGFGGDAQPDEDVGAAADDDLAGHPDRTVPTGRSPWGALPEGIGEADGPVPDPAEAPTTLLDEGPPTSSTQAATVVEPPPPPADPAALRRLVSAAREFDERAGRDARSVLAVFDTATRLAGGRTGGEIAKTLAKVQGAVDRAGDAASRASSAARDAGLARTMRDAENARDRAEIATSEARSAARDAEDALSALHVAVQEEARRTEEERARADAERIRAEARMRAEEEGRRAEAARRQAEEEARRLAAEAAELARVAAARAEEDRRQAEEDRRRAAELAAHEAAAAEERRRREEEDRLRREEEQRRIAAEEQRLAAERAAEQERRRADEARRLEEAARRLVEEIAAADGAARTAADDHAALAAAVREAGVAGEAVAALLDEARRSADQAAGAAAEARQAAGSDADRIAERARFRAEAAAEAAGASRRAGLAALDAARREADARREQQSRRREQAATDAARAAEEAHRLAVESDGVTRRGREIAHGRTEEGVRQALAQLARSASRASDAAAAARAAADGARDAATADDAERLAEAARREHYRAQAAREQADDLIAELAAAADAARDRDARAAAAVADQRRAEARAALDAALRDARPLLDARSADDPPTPELEALAAAVQAANAAVEADAVAAAAAEVSRHTAAAQAARVARDDQRAAAARIAAAQTAAAAAVTAAEALVARIEGARDRGDTTILAALEPVDALRADVAEARHEADEAARPETAEAAATRANRALVALETAVGAAARLVAAHDDAAVQRRADDARRARAADDATARAHAQRARAAVAEAAIAYGGLDDDALAARLGDATAAADDAERLVDGLDATLDEDAVARRAEVVARADAAVAAATATQLGVAARRADEQRAVAERAAARARGVAGDGGSEVARLAAEAASAAARAHAATRLDEAHAALRDARGLAARAARAADDVERASHLERARTAARRAAALDADARRFVAAEPLLAAFAQPVHSVAADVAQAADAAERSSEPTECGRHAERAVAEVARAEALAARLAEQVGVSSAIAAHRAAAAAAVERATATAAVAADLDVESRAAIAAALSDARDAMAVFDRATTDAEARAGRVAAEAAARRAEDQVAVARKAAATLAFAQQRAEIAQIASDAAQAALRLADDVGRLTEDHPDVTAARTDAREQAHQARRHANEAAHAATLDAAVDAANRAAQARDAARAAVERAHQAAGAMAAEKDARARAARDASAAGARQRLSAAAEQALALGDRAAAMVRHGAQLAGPAPATATTAALAVLRDAAARVTDRTSRVRPADAFGPSEIEHAAQLAEADVAAAREALVYVEHGLAEVERVAAAHHAQVEVDGAHRELDEIVARVSQRLADAERALFDARSPGATEALSDAASLHHQIAAAARGATTPAATLAALASGRQGAVRFDRAIDQAFAAWDVEKAAAEAQRGDATTLARLRAEAQAAAQGARVVAEKARRTQAHAADDALRAASRDVGLAAETASAAALRADVAPTLEATRAAHAEALAAADRADVAFTAFERALEGVPVAPPPPAPAAVAPPLPTPTPTPPPAKAPTEPPPPKVLRPTPAPPTPDTKRPAPPPPPTRRARRWLGGSAAVVGAGAGVLALLGVIAAIVVYVMLSRELPTVEALQAYQPPTVTTVHDHEGRLLGEIYEVRRYVVPLEEIPAHVQNAFIAAEDAKFWDHGGVNWLGLVRATTAMATGGKTQGASTITMQVTRNFLLTRDRTAKRKIKEIILARRIESVYDKEHILYLYLNEIYLGSGAYGVEAAARTYFGKHVGELTIAEAAMIAGLAPAPSTYSPHQNFEMARTRQDYVLDQMKDKGFITEAEAAAALAEELVVVERENEFLTTAPYFTEHVRRYLVDTYGHDRVYNEGLQVTTTCDLDLQKIATDAVIRGVDDVDQRMGFRREGVETLTADRIPARRAEIEQQLREAWAEEQDPAGRIPLPERSVLVPGRTYTGILLEVQPRWARVAIGDHEGIIPIAWSDWVYTPDTGRSWRARTQTNLTELVDADGDGTREGGILRVGDVVLVKVAALSTRESEVASAFTGTPGATSDVVAVRLWQDPEVESALLSFDLNTGAVRAMVGGASFEDSEFNRATQARRQVGSTFKPIVYAAAIETEKVTTATLVTDGPLAFATDQDFIWKPSNYGNDFAGNITLRQALAMSKNTCTVRVLDRIDPGMNDDVIYRFARKLGFGGPPTHLLPEGHTATPDNDYLCPWVRETPTSTICMDRLPPKDPNLSNTAHRARIGPDDVYMCRACDLSMGLGSRSFTMEEMLRGYSAFPSGGKLIQPYYIEQVRDRNGNVLEQHQPQEFAQVISPEVASITTWLLENVVQGGTGSAAQRLGVHLGGKTGTTNDEKDAWFIGFSPDVITGVWVGFDQPRPLGVSSTGGRTSLPIWMEYMEAAAPRDRDRPFRMRGNVEWAQIEESTGRRVESGGRSYPFLPGTAPESTGAVAGQVSIEDIATEL